MKSICLAFVTIVFVLTTRGHAFTSSKALRESIARNPSNLRAHLQIGSLHFKARSYRKALKHWIYVARRRPKSINLRYYIGVAYYRLHEQKYLEKAQSIWEYVLRSCPNHPKALHALERVKKELEKKTTPTPTPQKLGLKAGQQREKAMQSRLDGDPLRGTRMLQPLVDDGETSPAIIKELALCYLEDAEKPQLAIKYFQLTLIKTPGDLGAMIGLAQAHGLVGNFQKQIEIFEESLLRNPDDPEVHFQLGLAYDQMENPPKLVEHFQRAVQLDASYKKRLGATIKNLKTAGAIGRDIEMIMDRTEDSLLSEEEIDALARRFANKFGLDEPTPEQMRNIKEKAKGFRRKRRF